ncbi:Pyruvate decarboxylase [Fusarium falciforme]|uniref:Pyruvate decarboxylase n=1 Tax=Fusarium falciforme TaxID=195108 RepID=UPI002300A3E8|nr:Pyruvate decarboxylase [Fusarium falciforme]WAO91411.1 Pyruvate decarboxylase [Fusarium falciforme]
MASNSMSTENGVPTQSTVTGASNFFEALYDAGTRYCFVNLGSDHPALLEAMAASKSDKTKRLPTIVTCPSELVALSAALGYGQVTGTAQCVIVHVDCGTLAMGQSIHNASIGRVPVLMFAGLSPITQEGELLGSRTEFIHWIQDVPDQAAIVRQYCRYTAEVRVGHNIKQLVNRAIQIATSDPKGPAYLTASREALEQASRQNGVPRCPVRSRNLASSTTYPALGMNMNLTRSEIELIGKSLIRAERPLVITGYLGRNVRAPPLLEALCDRLPIEVIETIGSDLCISSAHEAYRGVTISTHPLVPDADVILVLDCDVPWVPTQGTPSKDAKIFHLDVDPLKQHMSLFYINAHRRYTASCELALEQLNAFLDRQNLDRSSLAGRFEARRNRYQEWRASLLSREVPAGDGIVRVPYFISRLRESLPQNTTVVMEAVTNAIPVIHHLNLTKPGGLLGSGAGGLGWLGGAAMGVKLAKPHDFVCAIVGDGTFLFSQMESAFWISKRYDIPFLLIVLNNGGWNAPKVSALLVHKDGLSSRHDRKDLNLSFEPSPDYAGIAAAAGNSYGALIETEDQVEPVLKEAVNTVQSGKSAVVEVR